MSLFSSPQQQPQQLFQQQSQQQQPFQQTSPFFQSQQQPLQFQQQPLQFQQQQQQFQLQQQQQNQQQQQFFLFTNEKAPVSYGTKWADLHPESQKFLLQIEERILEYRVESQKLDHCSRLYDSSLTNAGFEFDANNVVQELGGITTAVEKHIGQLHELMTVVKDMLRHTEVAVQSLAMLRPKFLHRNTSVPVISSATQSQEAGSIVPYGARNQGRSPSMVPVFDFYTGLPRKPSPFFQQTVSRLEKHLGECSQWIQNLEQLLTSNNRNYSNHGLSLLQSLPNVMFNVHSFFVHVASKVESMHQHIESMKTAYLMEKRHRGGGSDPFLEADRREKSKLEAAAVRIHPTIHLPIMAQTSTQAAGLFANAPAATTAQQSFMSQVVAPISSGSGFSVFGTTSPPLPSAPPLFSTPFTPATTSSLFGSSAVSPQTSLFNVSSPLFGTASTPSTFSTAAPAFGSTPSSGTSLFATPLSSGPATGSAFGTTTKSSRPKSRIARR